MSTHRASRGARRAARPSSGVRRIRALLTLIALGALGTGMSVQGTFASWSDSATVQTGTFQTGTLDITLGGNLVGAGGTWNNTAFNLTSMAPGESVAVSFPVKNNGSIGLTYKVTGTGSGALAVTNGLQYSVTYGVNAANAGNATNASRRGSCGTPATDANTTLLNASSKELAASRPLAAGVTETVCIVAHLHSAAPNALQGKSGSAALVFDAVQAGA